MRGSLSESAPRKRTVPWGCPTYGFALSVLLGCTATPQDSTTAGAAGARRSAIAYGTLDTVHTAVVAVLAPVGPTELEECTGTIVQVQNGNGYVLTAAHCCNAYVPTVVVVSDDYAVGEAYVSGSPSPVPPVYPVVAGSVVYDALYDGEDHDFCMLQFSGATADTATIGLPTTSGDGLELGSTVEHVGFGQTQTSPTNTQRRTGTDTIDLALTPLVVEFSQGGPQDIPGTCEGDSGGPSLFPASAAQAQQVVVAVQSYGNATTCAAETLGVGSRVISEIGPGAFITSYLTNSPVGVQAGPDGGSTGTDASAGGTDAGAGDADAGPAPSPAPVPAAADWSLAAMAALLLGVGCRASA